MIHQRLIPALPLLGDEVLSVNGVVMQGLSHDQAIKLFKEVGNVGP